jgi:hypothetical protein
MFPTKDGTLHFICPRQADDWEGMDEDARSFWCATIGNSFLSKANRRANETSDWAGFKRSMLPTAIEGEISDVLAAFKEWHVGPIAEVGSTLAEQAADVWY